MDIVNLFIEKSTRRPPWKANKPNSQVSRTFFGRANRWGVSYYRERRKIILFFFLFPSTKFVLLGLLFDFHPLYCVCVCVCVFFFSLALNCLGNCGDALVLHLSSSLQPSVRWNSNSLRVRSIVPRSHHSTCVCVLYIYTLTHTHTHTHLTLSARDAVNWIAKTQGDSLSSSKMAREKSGKLSLLFPDSCFSSLSITLKMFPRGNDQR